MTRPLAALLCAFGAVLSAALLTESVFAATTAATAANTTIDWLHNWNGATVSDGTFLLPSVDDITNGNGSAVINQGKTVEVNSPVSQAAGNIVIGNTNTGLNEAFLNINAGGSLTAQDIWISQSTDPGTLNLSGGDLTLIEDIRVNAGGAFNMTGGTLTSVDNATNNRNVFFNSDGLGGVVNISGGALNAIGSAPADVIRFEADEINVSGGTINATGGQVLFADTTTFTVEGSAADITMDRLNLNTSSRAATVNFNFDSGGISPIKNNSFLGLSFATINIDGTNYTGGGGTFDLFTAPNVASLAPTVNVTGFGVEGVDYTFEQSTTSNIVQLTVLAPEIPDRFARIDLDGSDNSLFNGSFEDVTLDLGTAGTTGTITGSNTSFDLNEVNAYTVEQWAPFSSDPNNVVGRYGNAGTETTDSFYLDATSTTSAIAGTFDGERGVLLNSVEGYQNGLVNEDFLAGLDPKFINEDAEYKLTVELTRRVTTLGGDPTATATVSVTDSDSDPTNSANAIPGGTITENIGGLANGTTQFELVLSGADLINATQLNLVVETVNSLAIGVEDVAGQDTDFVSQIVFDNFQLTAYLPGDSDADFDVDADDYAAWKAGFGTTGTADYFDGDFNGDGNVDAADYTVWRDNYTGSLDPPAAAAVPEPSAVVLLLSLALFGRIGRRRS